MGVVNDNKRRHLGLPARRCFALQILREMKEYREGVIREGTFPAKYVAFSQEIRALERAISSLEKEIEDESGKEAL